MALPLTKPVILPLAEERRRHQRVKVNLLGRYMLADRREFPCQVIDMSPGGMALIAPIAGQPGERRSFGPAGRPNCPSPREWFRDDYFGHIAQA
jgi:PilZ domain